MKMNVLDLEFAHQINVVKIQLDRTDVSVLGQYVVMVGLKRSDKVA